jgi:hypothetical protein
MRKIMDSEQADMLAQEIEADLTSPGSFHQMTEFPGYEALGLNPDLPEDDTVVDAIGSAMRASSVHANEDFGRLSAMIQYGIVNVYIYPRRDSYA